MKKIRNSIIAGAALMLIVMFLHPPFMAIDPASNGRVHGSLGWHAVWNPPSPEFVFRTLYPDAATLPDAIRLADFVPRVNMVLLTLCSLAVVLAAGLSTWALGRRGARVDGLHR